ncbi:hypothetical protein Fuma_05919 [Fuerstiella marisgermanici]|uniref:Uncharacterized protein n=1 Tax=Fuerstiella marisgermanici TaxID=1891926 RepID=A0A1P8WQC1_9PLAN|nr:hypothetical protein Fuma_05919 [Fuerstiella marisgermanici]
MPLRWMGGLVKIVYLWIALPESLIQYWWFAESNSGSHAIDYRNKGQANDANIQSGSMRDCDCSGAA